MTTKGHIITAPGLLYKSAGWYPDNIVPRKIRVTCPGCQREFAALRSKYTKKIKNFTIDTDGKMQAVEFKSFCLKCETTFTFKLYCS